VEARGIKTESPSTVTSLSTVSGKEDCNRKDLYSESIIGMLAKNCLSGTKSLVRWKKYGNSLTSDDQSSLP